MVGMSLKQSNMRSQAWLRRSIAFVYLTVSRKELEMERTYSQLAYLQYYDESSFQQPESVIFGNSLQQW